MKMKFRPYNRQAKKFMQTMFQNAFGEEELLVWRGVVVVPVPLSSGRMNTRGFNQAELIANEIASLVGGSLRPDILIRRQYVKPQSLMPDVVARHANIRDAFRVAPAYTRDKMPNRILLVDDVYTSGSTLTECARVVKAVSPSTEVLAFTLARG